MYQKIRLFYLLLPFFLLGYTISFALRAPGNLSRPGAEQIDQYLPLLEGKRVALLINQTSVVGQTLLLDTLLSRGVKVIRIFVPEHGFRGTADAGAHIDNEKDPATGLQVVSLYGKNKKPTEAQLADVDVLIYDLQDVGVRFYTYISTLQYAMEACTEYKKQLIILDRPNPNGAYVDGPVLDTSLRSFVGMQPIPVVYGMTAGEYARMLKGEAWFPHAAELDLQVIPCRNYMHSMQYSLPVAPSPNLKNMAAVYLYPSLCLFEGTAVSIGRGTDMPFQQWGHPDGAGTDEYYFVPGSRPGAHQPVLEGKKCYGELVADNAMEAYRIIGQKLQLKYLMKAYAQSKNKAKFFNSFFESLAGTRQLRQQIVAGQTEGQIRKSWQPALERFKTIRKKYLLYR